MMKRTIRIIGFLLLEGVGGLVMSCVEPTHDDAKDQSDEPGNPAKERENAMTATKEAAEALKVYAYAERDEFIDVANRDLAEIQAEMDRLRQVAARSRGAARADAEAKLEVVAERWADAKAHVERAESATESTWEDAQARYRKTRSDLKTSLDESRQWLSDRIEP